MVWIWNMDLEKLILDPESRDQKSNGYRIPDPEPQHSRELIFSKFLRENKNI
jgi:hypothetical protein